MFSYLHRYHAGCFADIHKHLVLLGILQSLQKKATPFCVLDSHAGEGVYDLNSVESRKTAEHLQGIHKLWNIKEPIDLVKDFLEIVGSYNKVGEHRYYPGSPAIMSQMLRSHDVGIFVEKHPQAITALRAFSRRQNKKIRVHERDSLEAIKALVPFTEKRGLIFIDPSYEVKTEYVSIIETVQSAYQRFTQGIFAVWYPILTEGYHENLLRQLKKTGIKEIFQCEWSPHPEEPQGMIGSGMVIINSPWQLDVSLENTFKSLNKTLFTHGQYKQGWLYV
ncbi:23S rRNA (adenine(2030)-N(6))-methyltransferase RlmJ [Candidatus Berkiella aquae]|uniref:Ribosomal RNA large subunit methyltransferase J n=1 Tax=Candidatus Berkiella aquae TaxID=295108 RepID=A0A0Q9YSG2_9GAMM|nr:23S rRNA (adenine(2030)-N(6))-methyltransferase RlmJ [Candidatus Berkiella aquae]MCS5711702.1 23S rRNA (adenine(2030)-N(6))-methyltransferase RlmJ [Candidatus Berkiella aquae]